jgi:hypothetical protein
MRGGGPAATRAALVAAGSLALLACAGWLGLRVKPRPLPPHAQRTPQLETIALPSGLPEPVRRYYLATVGEEVPRTETVVVWGRGEFNLNGLWFPARFKTSYDVPGRAFRRDMELTWFGIPVFRGGDVYLGGKGILEIIGLFGLVKISYEGEKIDQGDNLAMWGELLGYAPSALLLDPRVGWEPIDAHAARLVVPFGEQEDSLRVEFDPETGLTTRISGMRYRNQEAVKTPWRAQGSEWKTVHGTKMPHKSEATWEDRGEPYVVLDLEGAAYDVDVSEEIRAGL